MADFVPVTPGTGRNIATDSISGVDYPRSKIIIGADGTNDGDVAATNPMPVAFSTAKGGPAFDAFARFRMSNPIGIFESKLLYDKRSDLWDESITNNSGNATSTHSTTNASVAMYVENGDTIIRQTKQWFNYQPGKSQMIMMTTVLGSGATGVTKRVGYFNSNNGLFLELSGSTLSVVVRKNGTDTTINQSSWNIDKLDGTGASGITLNVTKAQIFFIDFEWLGVGRVRFGFVIDGQIYYCHQVLNANNATSVYMSTPNLPLRYEIASTSGSETLTHICSSISSEGGVRDDDAGHIHSFSTGASSNVLEANDIDTIYAAIGLRLKSTHLGTTILPTNISVLATTNDDFRWILCINPTIAGTFTFNDITSSALQGARGATANTISNLGTVVAEGYVSKTTREITLDLRNSQRIGSQIDGTREQLVLAIMPLSPNIDIYSTIRWTEIY